MARGWKLRLKDTQETNDKKHDAENRVAKKGSANSAGGNNVLWAVS